MKANVIKSASSKQQDNVVDLLAYFRVVMYRKWLILLFTLLFTGVAAYILSQLSPVYKATTTVLIEEDRPSLTPLQDVYTQGGYDKSYFLTQFEILKSLDLAEKIVSRLNLHSNPIFNPGQKKAGFFDSIFSGSEEPLSDGSIESGVLQSGQETSDLSVALDKPENEVDKESDAFYDVLSRFRNNLSVESVRNTQVVKISFESVDPELSALITNTMADVYIESHLQAKLDATQKATSWLNGQLDGLRDNLKKSELALQQYRENFGLVDIDGVKTLDSKELTDLTGRFVEARGKRYEAETIYRQIEALGPNASLDRLMGIPSVLRDALVQRLKQEQARADQKVAELNKLLGPKHPDMIAAFSEAEASKKALRQQVLRVVDGVKADYRLAQQAESSLGSRIEVSKKRFQDINRQEFKLKELEREVETNRQMYGLFFKRAKENDQIGGIQKAHARIIDKAKAPRFPVRPKKKIILLMVFISSLIILIVFFIAWDYFDDSFKTIEDIEDQFKKDVFAKIPLVKNKKSMVNIDEGVISNDFDEAIRTLRTSFVISSLDNPYRVALVTSSLPDEGKSTISSNLALTLSKMEKTLIIDADLRKAGLAKVLGLDIAGPGLSDILTSDFNVKKTIHQISDSFHFLPAGRVSEKPLEILSSGDMGRLLEELKKEYDRIIIDSPPVIAVSDSVLLSKHADSIVYVVRANSTNPNVVARGFKIFEQADKQVDGIVLNCVDKASEKYYGGYDVGYGYGYS